MVAKLKKITIRLTVEDYLAVRDEAYSKGQDMGPTVEEWIKPRLQTLRAKQTSANEANQRRAG